MRTDGAMRTGGACGRGACGRLGQQHCCCMADSFLAIRTDGSGWEAMGADGNDAEGWERMGGLGMMEADGNGWEGWDWEKRENLSILLQGAK